MKILVPIKQVIDANVRIRVNADNSGIEQTGVTMAMNPFCRIAVEEAVRIREAGRADEVIVVTIGNQTCQDMLITALAMGADRAVWIQSDHNLQPLAVARVLVHIVFQLATDLVILGKQSIDEDNSQTGPMLAGLLGWPQGTFASKIEFVTDAVHVTREIDGGLQTVSLRLPAVITTDLRLNEPRYVSLPNILKARKKPLDRINIADLPVDVTPTSRVLSVTEPPRRATGTRLTHISELVDKLRHEARVI